MSDTHAPETSEREGRSPSLVICLFLLAYFVTRLASLNVLPIFLDEGVHLQWAERLHDEGRLLKPVASGRLLAVAAYGLALPFEDRLRAARAISSIAGAITLIATMMLARRLYGNRASMVAGLLYLMSPFALVYDRLALSDGFLAAAITSLMVASHALIERPESTRSRLTVALLIGIAVVAKVSAILFLGLIPLGVLIFAKNRVVLKGVSIAMVLGLMAASPMLWFFARNSGEIGAQHVVDPMTSGPILTSTLRDMSQWLSAYFTVPSLIAAGLALFFLRDRRAAWLAATAFAPFFLFALFSQPWSARYILPTLAPVLVLVAGGIDAMTRRFGTSSRFAASAILTLLSSAMTIPFSIELLTDPAKAPFPPDDRIQLVTGWPSGYGIRELAGRLKVEAATAPLLVFVDTGGTRTASLDLSVLLRRERRIQLVEGDFNSADFRAAMIEPTLGRVLAVLTPHAMDPDFKSAWPGILIERLQRYERPGGEWAASLFEIHVARPTIQH